VLVVVGSQEAGGVRRRDWSSRKSPRFLSGTVLAAHQPAFDIPD
jgi:hypothetical protein